MAASRQLAEATSGLVSTLRAVSARRKDQTAQSQLAAGILSAARGGGAAPPPDAAELAAGAGIAVDTYGQLFEALLRGWRLLPVGLYRRLQPGVPPSPPQGACSAAAHRDALCCARVARDPAAARASCPPRAPPSTTRC